MEKDKKQQVEAMFDGIAPTYDALNHLLSFGVDRGWRKRVVKMVAEAGVSRILDVATGTGDLAIALARRIPAARVTGVDISENMLDVGRKKIESIGITTPPLRGTPPREGNYPLTVSAGVVLQTGDAEALDFPDGEFDAVTVAFGVRNFGDIPAGLREMQRVLKPGGRCFILEFSEPRPTSLFGRVYRIYFHRVLPRLGRLVSRDAAAYTYLPQSVDGFPAPGRFVEMLREAGFAAVCTKKLTFGVAYIYEAVK